MMSSPFYEAAHSGNLIAALKLIDSLKLNFSRFSLFSGYVCPVQKITGNQIPVALAYRISQESNLKLNDKIFLMNSKTGNSMAERMLFLPEYSGQVSDGNYIIVDDVFTTGITLKYLKNYIESTGNSVNSIYTLGNSKHGLRFEPSKLDLRILVARFPQIERYFNLSELTFSQVHFMLRFPSLDSFHYYIFTKQTEILCS
ncbi:MAG: phosphoribosyltransferase [Lentimicrobium sp.]|nr:phosphoribosyltransferase [Lentimicrobium sp.]